MLTVIYSPLGDGIRPPRQDVVILNLDARIESRVAVTAWHLA